MLNFLSRFFSCPSELRKLREKHTILKNNLEWYKKAYKTLSSEREQQNTYLLELEAKYEEALKSPSTHIVADFDRITAGRLTKDKPSPHSQLTKIALKNIAKNIVATSKDLYVIELFGDTNSMEPDIDDNTLLVAHKYNPSDYEIKPEDIVHYVHPNVAGRVLHRVEKIRTGDDGNPEYYIRGDNNPWGDGWFGDDAIIGIACGKIWGEEPDNEVND